MALLGVLARVHVPARARVIQQLSQLTGTSTFSVDEDERLGILIETDDADEAHRVLTEEVKPIQGILGVWPVFSHFESERVDDEPVHGSQPAEAEVDG